MEAYVAALDRLPAHGQGFAHEHRDETRLDTRDLAALARASSWRVFDWIARVSDSEATVLVTGERGTGKELVAKAMHQRSKRAKVRSISAAATATRPEREEWCQQHPATDAGDRTRHAFDQCNAHGHERCKNASVVKPRRNSVPATLRSQGGERTLCVLLDEFIFSNRDAIIARTRASVAARHSPGPTELEILNGVPLFLDQLGDALRLAKSSDVIAHDRISHSAGLHGHELHRVGRTIGQVVHDYGDVCQAITELAVEQEAPISGEEFRTLNLCLDDAIAGAVSAYSRQREREIADQGFEHLGILAHELRNLLNTALLSYDGIKTGRVAIGGSTGMVLGRSLLGLRDLIDRSLAEVRMDVGISRFEHISVAEFVEEVEIGASIQAEMRGIHLSVGAVDPAMSIEGDRQILVAAVSNLLQNAFKFSREHGHVSLTVDATTDRVLMNVEDECGGLSGKPEELFQPFVQRGTDRSGVGLGLSVCLKAAKASSGELRVRNLPGKGCVFTLDLPRKDASA